MKALLLTCVAALGWASVANAAYIIDVTQDATGVEFQGSGTINLDATYQARGLSGELYPGIIPSSGYVTVGKSVYYGFETVLRPTPSTAFPTAFGTGGAYGPQNSLPGRQQSSVDAGAFIALASGSQLSVLYFEPSFTSRVPFTSSTIYAGQTLDTLGLTQGSYLYDFSYNGFEDTIAINVGPATVPEPTTLALLALPMGAAGLLVARRRGDRAPS